MQSLLRLHTPIIIPTTIVLTSSFSNLIIRIIFIFLLSFAEPDFPVTWLVFADPGLVRSGWRVVWHFDVSLRAGTWMFGEGRGDLEI
jgi:hypothetical protein